MTKTMNVEARSFRKQTLVFGLGLAFALSMAMAATAFAQRLPGTENGEWRYLGGDAGHTRSSPLTQVNAANFEDLEQQWVWRGDNFGPNLDYFARSTPIYVDGILYTVVTPRRQVVAIDPSTGRNALGFSRARDGQVFAFTQACLWKRGRLRRGGWARRDLFH